MVLDYVMRTLLLVILMNLKERDGGSTYITIGVMLRGEMISLVPGN